jgi:hypothetical protein
MPLQCQENADQHGHRYHSRNFLKERHNIDKGSLTKICQFAETSKRFGVTKVIRSQKALPEMNPRNFRDGLRVSNMGYDFCSLQFLTVLYVTSYQMVIE